MLDLMQQPTHHFWCFDSWLWCDYLYRVCSVHATVQGRERFHELQSQSTHIHCQWRSPAQLYQSFPHMNNIYFRKISQQPRNNLIITSYKMATLIKLLNRFSIKIQLTCKTCPHLTGKQLYGLRPLLSMIANNKNYYYLKSYPLSFMNLMYARCEVLCTNWMHVLASYSLIAALIALTPRESEKGTNLMHINIADFFYLLRLLSST